VEGPGPGILSVGSWTIPKYGLELWLLARNSRKAVFVINDDSGELLG